MQLHIHYGAGIDRVVFNGQTFDRRTMDREAKYQLRRAVVAEAVASGVAKDKFGDSKVGSKKPRYRGNKRTNRQ